MTTYELRQKIMADPAVRWWVKATIKELENSDPVEALNDIDLVRKFCQMKIREQEKGA